MRAAMPKLIVIILAELCAHVPAERIHAHKVAAALNDAETAEVEEAGTTAEEQALAEDLAEEEHEAIANPMDAYWYKHQGSWEFVAPELKSSEYMQQFKMTLSMGYHIKLDELQDAQYGNQFGAEVRKIDAEVLKVRDQFFTMHRHQTAVFTNEGGTQIGEYLMFKPQVFNRRMTWRVTKRNDPDKILFTIQKRLYDDCKGYVLHMGFDCRGVLKIYVGHKGDKSTLIYYGTHQGHEFMFYHSKEGFLQRRMSDHDQRSDKEPWAGRVRLAGTETCWGDSCSTTKDFYTVKVMPNEDAGLLLLASVALDRIHDSEQ